MKKTKYSIVFIFSVLLLWACNNTVEPSPEVSSNTVYNNDEEDKFDIDFALEMIPQTYEGDYSWLELAAFEDPSKFRIKGEFCDAVSDPEQTPVILTEEYYQCAELKDALNYVDMAFLPKLLSFYEGDVNHFDNGELKAVSYDESIIKTLVDASFDYIVIPDCYEDIILDKENITYESLNAVFIFHEKDDEASGMHGYYYSTNLEVAEDSDAYLLSLDVDGNKAFAYILK